MLLTSAFADEFMGDLLNMKVQSDGMELEIVLNTESDVAQMAKLLAKQVAVVSVNTLMLQEQAAV